MQFTFHYVSINSSVSAAIPVSHHQDLHSTMYLLIHISEPSTYSVSKFTFHYVSINSSKREAIYAEEKANLHSTMYLLIPDTTKSSASPSFYLHSTMYLLIPCMITQALQAEYIYIPLCIY